MRWKVVDAKAEPGQKMAVVVEERYRTQCAKDCPGIPVWTKEEMSMLHAIPRAKKFFLFAQRVKRVFGGRTRLIHAAPGKHATPSLEVKKMQD